MAKFEKTQMEVTLSSETKRYLRNLTSALEKVARSLGTHKASEPTEGPKRLSEPAEDAPKGHATGGYTGTGAKFSEPIPGHYIPRRQVEPDDTAWVEDLAQIVLKQKRDSQ